MPLLLAHAGHWLIWVLYAVPALIVFAAVIRALLVERRDGGSGAPPRGD